MSHGEVKQVNGKRVATSEYRSWQMMKNRCLNPRATDFARYGGRGVLADARWDTFEGFLADMGRKPTPQHTLERRDNNGHYTKDNCLWATRREQARNRGDYNTVGLDLADKIRHVYATGQFRQKDIAAHLGLNQADVSQITRNVRWARD